MLHADRRRAEGFGAEAERYDRSRPGYPPALIDEVLGSDPAGLSVLDAGCGTGIAAKLMADRGANVLGVEPDERMASLARRRGIQVEIGSFESWESGGRLFDRVTAGQAWHWVDPVVGPQKAASVLHRGGRLCVFWNNAQMPTDLESEIAGIYRRLAPGVDDYSVLVGCSRSDPAYLRDRYQTEIDGIRACVDLAEPNVGCFPWSRAYTRDEWLDQLPTHSDHAAMDPTQLERLLHEIGGAIDSFGGSFEMSYHAWLVSATRL
jgi:SAM-dependent methyltransferase